MIKKYRYAVSVGTLIIILVMVIAISPAVAFAWSADGVIPGTEIEYSALAVSRQGVSVKLTNTSTDDIKVSLKLTFLDNAGNSLGYSIFGLREISGGDSVAVSNNYLNGNWRACRDSARMDFSKMTYEPIYY